MRFRNASFVSLVLIGLATAFWRYAPINWNECADSKNATPTLSSKERHQDALRQEALQQAQIQLERVHVQSRRLVDEHLQELAEFFAAAKKRMPAFAEDVVGWGSKWRLTTDQIPYFGTRDAHARYVSECFDQQLFTHADVERLIAQVVASLRKDIEGLDDAMLVALRHDLCSFSHDGCLDSFRANDVRAFLDGLNSEGEAATSLVLRDDMVQLLVSSLVAEAIVQFANHMRASAVILGGSAAASKISLGTSLVVGLAVDQAVSWAWTRLADPKGQLVKRLNNRIDELYAAIVKGTTRTSGLRHKLMTEIDQRDQVRRAALVALLNDRCSQDVAR